MTFATQLKQARQRAGLSQAQAAELIGVSVQTIKSWEAGRREPPIEPAVTQPEALSAVRRCLSSE